MFLGLLLVPKVQWQSGVKEGPVHKDSVAILWMHKIRSVFGLSQFSLSFHLVLSEFCP